jgi:RNA polymerase subunit RPABC4/transcription elongation factor Spt4
MAITPAALTPRRSQLIRRCATCHRVDTGDVCPWCASTTWEAYTDADIRAEDLSADIAAQLAERRPALGRGLSTFSPAELEALPVGAAFRDDAAEDPAGWTFVKGFDSRWRAHRAPNGIAEDRFLTIFGREPWGGSLQLVAIDGVILGVERPAPPARVVTNLGLIVATARHLHPLAAASGAEFTVSVTPRGVEIRFTGAAVPQHLAAKPGPDGWRTLDIEGEPVSVCWMQS